MDIWMEDKLLLFILFVVPGFVSVKAYELLFPSEAIASKEKLVDAVAYSCVNYALLFPVYAFASEVEVLHGCAAAYFVGGLVALFIAPVCWVFALKRIRSTKWFLKNLPHPTAKPWDYFFGQRQPVWIIATLSDGSRIGGLFSEKSFASSSPASEQIYIEQAWRLNEDGGFDRPREESAGLLINGSEIRHLEFFEYENLEENHE